DRHNEPKPQAQSSHTTVLHEASIVFVTANIDLKPTKLGDDLTRASRSGCPQLANYRLFQQKR
ncbi:MAG: hypothetical protein KDA62_08715, partial [Planctomycetales bacterium]|nr:hypothetical protein [Planctomycetales bacterium]